MDWVQWCHRWAPDWDTIMITHEWWKPSPAEMDVYCSGMDDNLARQMRDHVDKGGLLLREVPGWKAQQDEQEEAGLPVSQRAPHRRNVRERLVRKP